MTLQDDKSRFIVGIDLGTTSSSLAYVDLEEKKNPLRTIRLFSIPQLIAPGRVGESTSLPSFLYLAKEGEFPKGACSLPWDTHGERKDIIGIWAKELGAEVPTQIVQSAKSWLVNESAHRGEAMLPLIAAEEKRRISPLFALKSFLVHLKEAWNFKMAKNAPENAFEVQQVILTVPASFDEAARALTAMAAKQAGIVDLTLLEEPQAAFYSWMEEHERELGTHIKEGGRALICDVGGGTTDFTLIEIKENGGVFTFQREAVGRHLLLGGDNMDAALAFHVRDKSGRTVDREQLESLKAVARKAKETLLGTGQERFSSFISGRGSKLIGEGFSVEISKKETEDFLTEGFFGLYPFEDALALQQGSGLRKVGLPYESDPSITKHLATFLKRNGVAKKPLYILFNGGAMIPAIFRERILQSLNTWFGDDKPISVLAPSNLELAVAKGAAYFGKVKRGFGINVGGGSPRGIYLSIDIKLPSKIEKKALSLLPRGAEEGSTYLSNEIFQLTPNTPVSFQLYHSCTRPTDPSGTILEITPEEMGPFPIVQTVMRYGKTKDPIGVRLGARLTPLGTLSLWLKAVHSEHSWNLEFDLREIGPTHAADESYDDAFVEKARKCVMEAFSLGGNISLMPALEALLEKPRNAFPPTLLRQLFDALMEQAAKRKLSTEYAARFWNSAGYFLRPGSGYPLDEHRIGKLWKLLLEEKGAPLADEVLIQKWICYRRISSGFQKGQQMQLFSEIQPALFGKRKDLKGKEEYLYAEKLRALASFEFVEVSLKIKLGEELLKRIAKGSAKPYEYWALARLGCRTPLYGAVGNIIPAKIAEKWVEGLLSSKIPFDDHFAFAIAMLARTTELEQVNIKKELQEIVESFFKRHAKNSEELISTLESKPFSDKTRERLFGDHLPSALSLFENA